MYKLPNGQIVDENEFDLEKQDSPEVGAAAAAKYLANSDPIDTENTSDPRVGQSVGQFNTRQPSNEQDQPEDNINWAEPSDSPQSNNAIKQDQPVENSDLFTTQSVNPQVAKYSNLLKELQDKRNDSNMVVNLARAGNQIAQGIAMGHGAKIDDGSTALDAIQKSNEQPILDYKAQIENQPNDPNSDISGFAREQALLAMQRLNPNMSPDKLKDLQTKFSNMTASQLEKAGFKGTSGMGIMTPYQQQMLDVYKNRIQNTKDQLDLGKERFSEKTSKEDSDLAQKMQKSLDSMTASSRTELGRLSRVASSARQLDLMLTNKKANEFDNRDMQELAIITNAMLSGGQTSAVSAINKLVPSTFAGNSAKFLEFITNEPKSAEAQDFVKNFKKIADREKISADLGLRKILGSNANGFYKLQDRQPEIYNNIINSKLNLNTELNQIYGDKNILKNAQESKQTSIKQDSKINDYAKSNNLDYEHAKAILIKRGYKPNEQ